MAAALVHDNRSGCFMLKVIKGSTHTHHTSTQQPVETSDNQMMAYIRHVGRETEQSHRQTPSSNNHNLLVI